MTQRNGVMPFVQVLFRSLYMYPFNQVSTETVTLPSVRVLRFPLKFDFVAFHCTYLKSINGNDVTLSVQVLFRSLCMHLSKKHAPIYPLILFYIGTCIGYEIVLERKA